MTSSYPRDLKGYGRNTPHPRWPGGARLAVQFVINYEEGGEYCILHGDDHSEGFVTEEPTPIYMNTRNLNVESQYDYGARAGFWRLHRLFTARGIPLTIFGVTMALGRNPEAVAAMNEAGWEIAAHGYRWINYQELPSAVEREHLHLAVGEHTRITGQRPLGWYQGRTSAISRRFVVEEGGFEYDADSFADDLPYWVYDWGPPHLVVPYTLDNNDVRFVTPYGYGGTDFVDHLSGALELLCREGETHPKMMSIGLHCRLAGRPSRAAQLERFLDNLMGRDDLWLTRRIDIARHWKGVHPPKPAGARADRPQTDLQLENG